VKRSFSKCNWLLRKHSQPLGLPLPSSQIFVEPFWSIEAQQLAVCVLLTCITGEESLRLNISRTLHNLSVIGAAADFSFLSRSAKPHRVILPTGFSLLVSQRHHAQRLSNIEIQRFKVLYAFVVLVTVLGKWTRSSHFDTLKGCKSGEGRQNT
jgi:hypothetical protein